MSADQVAASLGRSVGSRPTPDGWVSRGPFGLNTAQGPPNPFSNNVGGTDTRIVDKKNQMSQGYVSAQYSVRESREERPYNTGALVFSYVPESGMHIHGLAPKLSPYSLGQANGLLRRCFAAAAQSFVSITSTDAERKALLTGSPTECWNLEVVDSMTQKNVTELSVSDSLSMLTKRGVIEALRKIGFIHTAQTDTGNRMWSMISVVIWNVLDEAVNYWGGKPQLGNALWLLLVRTYNKSTGTYGAYQLVPRITYRDEIPPLGELSYLDINSYEETGAMYFVGTVIESPVKGTTPELAFQAAGLNPVLDDTAVYNAEQRCNRLKIAVGANPVARGNGVLVC